MFASHYLFNKKGALGRIWLAAHWDKKVSKSQVLQTKISEATSKKEVASHFIDCPIVFFPLHLPRHLFSLLAFPEAK